MDGPARLARVPRADGDTAWPSAELQAKELRARRGPRLQAEPLVFFYQT